jgi:hypothetical protein
MNPRLSLLCAALLAAGAYAGPAQAQQTTLPANDHPPIDCKARVDSTCIGAITPQCPAGQVYGPDPGAGGAYQCHVPPPPPPAPAPPATPPAAAGSCAVYRLNVGRTSVPGEYLYSSRSNVWAVPYLILSRGNRTGPLPTNVAGYICRPLGPAAMCTGGQFRGTYQFTCA